MALVDCLVLKTRADKSEAEVYAEYDRRTNRAMAAHNRAGGQVRKPVRTVGKASDRDKWDRAKFNARKAQQALSQNHPLVNEAGEPTPAALQFRRWGEKVPRTQQDLQDILARANRQKQAYRPDSAYSRGYADGWRGDARGQGVACGGGWISPRKKCSRDKAKTTSQENLAKTREKRKEMHELKGAVKAAKGQKPRPKLPNPTEVVKDLNAKGIKVKAAPYQMTRAEYIDAFPGSKKAIAKAFGDDVVLEKIWNGTYSIDYPQGWRRSGQWRAVGSTVKEAAYQYAINTGIAPDHYNAVYSAASAGGVRVARRALEADYPQVLTSLEVREKGLIQPKKRSDAFVSGYADGWRTDATRPTCLECVEKHLGSAAVLMEEAARGWPDHRLLAIGHLAQAEEESHDDIPLLAERVRSLRKQYQATNEPLDFRDLSGALRQYLAWRGDTDPDAIEMAESIKTAIASVMPSITAVTTFESEGDTLYGRFEAGGAPYAYTLNESEIAYWPIEMRQDAPENSGGKKQCKTGKPCGNTCISADATCHSEDNKPSDAPQEDDKPSEAPQGAQKATPNRKARGAIRNAFRLLRIVLKKLRRGVNRGLKRAREDSSPAFLKGYANGMEEE